MDNMKKKIPTIQEELTYLANRCRSHVPNYLDNNYLSNYREKDIENCYKILVHVLAAMSLDDVVLGEEFKVQHNILDEELYNIRMSIRKITGYNLY